MKSIPCSSSFPKLFVTFMHKDHWTGWKTLRPLYCATEVTKSVFLSLNFLSGCLKDCPWYLEPRLRLCPRPMVHNPSLGSEQSGMNIVFGIKHPVSKTAHYNFRSHMASLSPVYKMHLKVSLVASCTDSRLDQIS